jgi:PEP-CTERM motif
LSGKSATPKMKKTYIALLTIGTTALTLNTHANVLFEEGFNYTPGSDLGGSVNPGSGYAWESGNSGLTIGSGNLTYSGLQNIAGNELSVAWGSSGSATNGFANVTSGSVYYSFLLDVTTLPGANDYLTALNPGNGAKPAPNGSTDAIDAYIYSNGDIGLRTAGDAAVTDSTALTLDTTYLVVLEYNFTTTTASLYLDPTIGDAQPGATLSLTGNGSVTSISDVGFKSQATTGDFTVGNLIVGTDWSDVTPEATPEPSPLALAGLGLAAFGFISRMRR